MTDGLREYLTERRIRQIEENELMEVYLDCPGSITGELTVLLYDCGMDPMKELDEVIRGMFRSVDDKRFRTITIPSNIKHIRAGAFRFSNVQKIIIEEGCEQIHTFAFNNSKLRELTVPSSCKVIQRSAFRDCFDLNVIHYAGTKEDWHNILRRDKVTGSWFDMTIKVDCKDGILDTDEALQ